MSRFKLNKRSLILAVLVILLCMVFITGATLALFTGDVNDGTIGINAVSGNVDIDIVDTTPVERPPSLVGQVLHFYTTKESDEDLLFEPGATYYTEGFRIKNYGNIPVNFILYVSEDERIEDDFYDAFEVWITQNPEKGMRYAEELREYEGRLEPGAISDVYYLVVKMKEDAGNKFQGRPFEGFGVTVCAVQGNVNID